MCVLQARAHWNTQFHSAAVCRMRKYCLENAPEFYSPTNVHCDVAVAVETIVPSQLLNSTFQLVRYPVEPMELYKRINCHDYYRDDCGECMYVIVCSSRYSNFIGCIDYKSHHLQMFARFSSCSVVLQLYDRMAL